MASEAAAWPRTPVGTLSDAPDSAAPTTWGPDTVIATPAADALVEDPPEALQEPSKTFTISLFWRTFLLLGALFAGGMSVWTRTLLEHELEPRAIQTAHEIASVVSLVRTAMQGLDPIQRVALFKSLKDVEHVLIRPREPHDQTTPLADTYLINYIRPELLSRLGRETELAAAVNGDEGLWIAFRIDDDAFWLQTDLSRYAQPARETWVLWLVSAVLLSLAGAAVVARLIAKPLHDLALAAERVRGGDFAPSGLDEDARTTEIRAVNAGFNRMTAKLTENESNRTLMLAGISHDLRTPLARLRLELELSVPDASAREAMATDIAQVDAIIGKFLDYARPGQLKREAVCLNDLVNLCTQRLAAESDLRLRVILQPQLWVWADPVELQRVITNLIENARRYGKSPGSTQAQVDISARERDGGVLLRVRDHGPGVASDQLAQLTTPFFRGEAARTAATGTGLGLAIVEQTLKRMGGSLRLANTKSGGLLADITLQAPPPEQG